MEAVRAAAVCIRRKLDMYKFQPNRSPCAIVPSPNRNAFLVRKKIYHCLFGVEATV